MTDVEIDYDVEAVMRDGTVLRADVYRSANAGPRPAFLMRTPYGKRAVNFSFLDVLGTLSRGFIVVVQDTRGRGASEGEWLPWLHDGQDGFDTIEWLAGLKTCDGRVAMFGPSYMGNMQLLAAREQPPALVSIAPMTASIEPHDGLLQRGGANELGLGAWWSLMMAIEPLAHLAKSGQSGAQERLLTTEKALDQLGKRTYWELPSTAQPSVLATGQPDLAASNSNLTDSVVDSVRMAGRFENISVPTLAIGGWFDLFIQAAIDTFCQARAAGVPAELIIGPWTHGTIHGTDGGRGGDLNFGIDSLSPSDHSSLTAAQWEWAERSMGELTAPTKPPVHIFVMGINQWRREESWPLEQAVETAWFLQPGHGLAQQQPTDDVAVSCFEYDPSDPVPTTGGAFVMAPDYRAGSLDQRVVEERPDVLVFTSDVLAENLEVTGRVSAHLLVHTDAPSTDWVVRLCDVDEDGVSHNLADGIVRTTSEVGRVQEVEVDLWSTSNVFLAGHRIRVQVTSSSFPRWDRNLNTGEDPSRNPAGTHLRVAHQTVHHNRTHASRILLPVIPGNRLFTDDGGCSTSVVVGDGWDVGRGAVV